ncbi:MAG: efflux RND transporter periplasmic adaptor subunit [Mangrovibacterium sp.]
MKKMNLPAITALALLLASCGGKTENGPDALRKQLAELKQQREKLDGQIVAIQDQLDANKAIEYINIKTTEAQPQLFEHFIEVTGNVEADQELNVSPEGAGIITAILVQEGQNVQKGTRLATLNTDMLDQSIAEAQISLDLDKTTYERQKNLWDQKIGSEMQFLQAKTNKESMERRLESLMAQKNMAVVTAPVDGVVDAIFQKTGEIAGPQIPFARVVNISKVKIYGDVAETYLTKVDKQEAVFIDFPAIGRSEKSTISQIGNYIDPNNRTFRVRINLNNPDRLIKPNMISVLKIRDYVSQKAIVIPSILIKNDFKGEYTFVVDTSSELKKAKKIYVKSGISNNNMTEVSEGIEPGMLVISEGFDQVIDGTPVSY